MTRYQKYTAYWGAMVMLGFALWTKAVSGAEFTEGFKFALLVFIIGNVGSKAIDMMATKKKP